MTWTKFKSWYLSVKGKGNVNLQISEWVAGFITSYNIYSAKPVTLPDKEAAEVFVEKYCRENPVKTVLHASEALVRELGGSPGLKQE